MELNEIQIKKNLKVLKEISLSTKEAANVMAEACYAIAYIARKIDSEMKANERNRIKN